MILSHTHEFIFICNGKTGTTSIESVLMLYQEGEEFEVGSNENSLNLARFKQFRRWGGVEKESVVCQKLQENEGLLRNHIDNWFEAENHTLWWDNYRTVLSAQDSKGTYHALYGRWGPLRGWYGVRHALGKVQRVFSPLRWTGPFSVDVPLPPDAVVMNLREGLLVASAGSGRILKIHSGPRKIYECRNEVEAWRRAQRAGIENHVPSLYEFRIEADEPCWLCVELVPNRPPFYRMSHVLWQRRLREHILPVMQMYYEESGVDVVTGREWLDHMNEYLDAHPPPRAVRTLTNLAERVLPASEEVRTPRAVIHGDLHPGNVHWHGNRWWLIDWAVSRRMGILFDVLARPHYFLLRGKPVDDFESFWNWIRGEASIENVSTPLIEYLELWDEVQYLWTGTSCSPDALRFQLLMMWLELACFRSGKERVENYRSPESVLQNVLYGLNISSTESE